MDDHIKRSSHERHVRLALEERREWGKDQRWRAAVRKCIVRVGCVTGHVTHNLNVLQPPTTAVNVASSSDEKGNKNCLQQGTKLLRAEQPRLPERADLNQVIAKLEQQL